MAHVTSYRYTAVGALCAHFARIEDKNGEYICLSNRDIDPLRTHLNYNLAPVHQDGQVSFVKKRLSEVDHYNRSNINVMTTWILTLPKGFEKEKEFFEEAYRFFSKRYGEENVISAYVHKDEHQPHMHFAFVPVKDNRLIASKVIDRTELRRIHPELMSYLEEKLGCEVPVLNGATAGGNRTVAEMKADRDTARLREISAQAEAYISKTEAEMKNLENMKEKLQEELRVLQGRILSKREQQELRATRGITGSVKGISYTDYEALLNTASYVEEVDVLNLELMERVKEKDTAIKDAEDRAKRALQERPSLALVSENAILKSKLTNMENRLVLLSAKVPERYQKTIKDILEDRGPTGGSRVSHHLG